MTWLNQFREHFPLFVKNGLPTFKQLMQYVFPKTGEEVEVLPSYPWFNRIARWAPYLSLLFIIMFIGWPFVLWFVYDHCNRAVAAIFLLNCICVISISGDLFKLFTCAALLKWKKRSSKLLLVLTLVPVCRILPVILILVGVYSVTCHYLKAELLGDEGISRVIKKSYLAHPDPSLPFHDNVFFGFKIGKDTFEKVKEALKQEKITYRVSFFDEVNKRFPIITIIGNSSQDPEFLKNAVMNFDGKNRLFRIQAYNVIRFTFDERLTKIKRQISTEEFRQYLSLSYSPLFKEVGWVKDYSDKFSLIYTAANSLLNFKSDDGSFCIVYLPLCQAAYKEIARLKKLEKLNQDKANQKAALNQVKINMGLD